MNCLVFKKQIQIFTDSRYCLWHLRDTGIAIGQ